MMQKFWPMLAIVGEEKACRIGQPILTRMKPSFLSELTIKRFSFGTIAPRFLGIRMHQTPNEEVIRCDLEMRYAGDPQIIIQVGPTEVEIVNLRISALMRCECLEFTPRMTPFKIGSCTLMKKPFVDFNIKVGGMEIMNNKAMIALVHSLFHKVLHHVAMYPKKIFVPMGRPGEKDDVDIEKLKALTPVGILYLTLERGVDLVQVRQYVCSADCACHCRIYVCSVVAPHSFCLTNYCRYSLLFRPTSWVGPTPTWRSRPSIRRCARRPLTEVSIRSGTKPTTSSSTIAARRSSSSPSSTPIT